jgi:hypothetical protein
MEQIVQALKTPYMFVWSLNLKPTTSFHVNWSNLLQLILFFLKYIYNIQIHHF